MKKILFFAGAVLFGLSAVAQPKLGKDNIDEVMAAMTLEEKANLLVGSGWGGASAGSMTAFSEVLVPGAAGTTRGIPRLGIPQTVLSDGPAGLRINPRREGTDKTFYCTGFPVGTVMASTWNTDLVREMTVAMGNEVKEYGADVLLAPGMNLHRNPLCGRNFEYFSEDPYLTGKIAAAYVDGIQSNGVGVSIKHFAGNSQETDRMNNDARITVRALRELYLKGFEIAVKEAHPWTVMSSYNRINGPYTQENGELLTDILRGEWGFDGLVMTDWTGVRNTAAQLHAQNDLMEPGMEPQVQAIIDAVGDGSLSMEDVDRSVRNMLNFIVKTPRFAKYAYSDAPDLEAHAALVRRSAPEGMVLLENNGVLPLKGMKSVALFGTGAYDFIAGGTGSGNVNKPYVRNLVDGFTGNGYVVDEKVKDLYVKYIADQREARRTASGRILLGDAVVAEMPLSADAVSASAAANDVAVFVISRNAGEGADRTAAKGDFLLNDVETEDLGTICDAYHKAGKKVVVVLNIGGVIETASWKNLPDAVLLAWTPGQEGGNSVADVLTGAAYPSGKLPMTFPVNYMDIPSSANFPYEHVRRGRDGGDHQPVRNVDYTDYEEDIWVGYRYFNTAGKEVSYPFGYGLSYTRFKYGRAKVKVLADGSLKVTVKVKNVGKAAGKEAVGIYVQAPDGGLVKPACELRAFGKTGELKPRQKQVLSFVIDPYTLASYNEGTSSWETAAGKYKVLVGASVEDIRSSRTVSVKEGRSWKTNDVMHPQQEIAVMKVR